MTETLWPTVIEKEIKDIETEIRLCFDMNTPIDTVKLKRLSQLRIDRLKELVNTHDQRLEWMKAQTRHMTAKLSGLKLDAKPDIKEKLLEEQERYDKAATHWVISENCLWGESEAASIAAGILILAAQ